MKQNSSQIQPLNIGSLDFHQSHPDTYTLLKLDSSRVCFTEANFWESYEDLKEIGPKFLKKSLAYEKGLIVGKDPNPNHASEQDLTHQLFCTKKFLKTSSEERSYYVISLYQKGMTFKSINLINCLHQSEGDDKNNKHEGESLFKNLEQNVLPNFACQASLILFHQEKQNEAMAYGFGKWNMLIDHSCIVPKWGLTVISSSRGSDPDHVKEVKVTLYRTSNLSTKIFWVKAPTRIESFGFEVGSHGLDYVKGSLNKEYNIAHFAKGDDYLQFSVDFNRNQDDEDHLTIHSLEKIATHFQSLTNSEEFTIHERMKEFIDQEVKKAAIISALHKRAKEEKDALFVDKSLWAVGGGKKCVFGSLQKREPLEALQLNSQGSLSELKIKVFSRKGQNYFKEIEILPFLSSNPLEYQNNFYRLEKGKWFIVPASRFESIKEILRQRQISADSLGLPPYELKDIEFLASKTQAKEDYKEIIYNKKAVKSLSENAILLDRLNISLGESTSNKFEFCDILLKKDNMLYIIHNKRIKAKQLSHLREQVERTGDFLATELKKKSYSDFFFKLIFKDFEEKIKSIRWKRKSNFFQSLKFDKKEKEVNIFSKILKENEKDEKLQAFVRKLKATFPEEDATLLIDHRDKLILFFDRLFDYCQNNKKNKKEDIKEEVIKFLKRFKSSVEMQEILFQNGPCKRENLKRIQIILAIIDDRKVEKAFKEIKKNEEEKVAKKGKKEIKKEIKKEEKDTNPTSLDSKKEKGNPIFNKQDLWGLDKTRLSIEKQGFGFNIVIINEETNGFDVFGEKAKDTVTPESQKEDKDKGNKIGEIKTWRTTGNQIEVTLSPKPDLTPKQAQELLKKRFKNAIANKINTQEIQILRFSGDINLRERLYSEYLTCPTTGDGDCFFHAVFTNARESVKDLKVRAGQLRRRFVKAVKNGKYHDVIKNLLYDHYKYLYVTDQSKIPHEIRERFCENFIFEGLRPNVLKHKNSLEKHFPGNFFQEFEREFIYSQDQIEQLFSPSLINEYIKPLRNAGDFDSYIPVLKDKICPAEIIALMIEKKINIFTWNQDKNALDLFKKSSIHSEGEIVNILLDKKHFTRLQSLGDSDEQFRQAIQILKNSGIKEFQEIVWTEMDRLSQNDEELLVKKIDEDPTLLTKASSQKQDVSEIKPNSEPTVKSSKKSL